MKKVSVEQMKEFLLHAMNFERYVFTWNRSLKLLDREIANVQAEQRQLERKQQGAINDQESIHKKYAQKKEKDQSNTVKDIAELEERIKICSKRRFKFFALALVFGAIGAYLISLIVKKFDWTTFDIIFESLMLVGMLGIVIMIPCIIFSIRCLVDNLRLKNAIKKLPMLRNAAPKDYTEKENQEITKVLNSVSNVPYELQKLSFKEAALAEQRERAMLELQLAKKTLHDIYALDFIHRDYQDFVAVSTMYGYLDRGKCTIIEGHGGIFYTFELDLQLGQIIRNLQDLNAAMERVEANQRELIHQARIANNHLAGMEKSLQSIDYNTGCIKENTAMTALAANQAADELKWQSSRMRYW